MTKRGRTESRDRAAEAGEMRLLWCISGNMFIVSGFGVPEILLKPSDKLPEYKCGFLE